MNRQDDEGTVLVLTLGLAVVLLLLVGVVTDVSAVILDKRAVASAADGAAVAAAQQQDEAVIDRQGVGSRVPLDPADVSAVVSDYAQQEQDELPGLQLFGSVAPDDQTLVIVEARRSVKLPFVGWLKLAAVDVHAEARARSAVQP